MCIRDRYAGVLHAPISPAYSLVSQDLGTLTHVARLIAPGLIYAPDARFARAVAAIAGPDVETLDAGGLAALLDTRPSPDLDRAHAAIDERLRDALHARQRLGVGQARESVAVTPREQRAIGRGRSARIPDRSPIASSTGPRPRPIARCSRGATATDSRA